MTWLILIATPVKCAARSLCLLLVVELGQFWLVIGRWFGRSIGTIQIPGYSTQLFPLPHCLSSLKNEKEGNEFFPILTRNTREFKMYSKTVHKGIQIECSTSHKMSFYLYVHFTMKYCFNYGHVKYHRLSMFQTNIQSMGLWRFLDKAILNM